MINAESTAPVPRLIKVERLGANTRLYFGYLGKDVAKACPITDEKYRCSELFVVPHILGQIFVEVGTC